MSIPEDTFLRGRSPHRPPERFHVFVSYTTREDEVRVVKPMVDHFLQTVLRPVIEQNLSEHPVFYDGYSLHHPDGRRLAERKLKKVLRFAIRESEVLVAFLSPSYPGSRWCRFEWETMAAKELRPWFDVCPSPPIPQLRDRRPADQRPDWLECLGAALLWKLWRLSGMKPKPGGVIIPVLWKGDVYSPPFPDGVEALQPFDWRSCGAMLPDRGRSSDDLFRHWSAGAGLDRECEAAMLATAAAIVDRLRKRRSLRPRG